VRVETIGVGQDEQAVAEAVETVVLVEAPNLGDDVQALKAGLLEIADLMVVAKGDLPGADRSVTMLRAALALELRLEPAAGRHHGHQGLATSSAEPTPADR